MRKTIAISVLALFLLLSLGSCDPTEGPGSGPDDTDAAGTVVNVYGNYTAPTTWTKGNLYCIEDWASFDALLTVEPGVIVAFGPGATLTIAANGSINATGTADERIVFTSYKDDFEDFTIPGASGDPAMSDWGYVWVRGGPSTLRSCEFRYAEIAVQADAANVTMRDSLFTRNDVALEARSVGAGFSVGGNTFYGNTHPFYAARNFSIDDTNTFQNQDGSVKNVFQAIELLNGSFETDVTWSCTKVAFATCDGNGLFTISAANTLTLGNGVVVKFTSNGSLTLDAGENLANYVNADFTSIKDDTLLGDSNGDGNATTPLASDEWQGIWNIDAGAYLSDGPEDFLHYATNQ